MIYCVPINIKFKIFIKRARRLFKSLAPSVKKLFLKQKKSWYNTEYLNSCCYTELICQFFQLLGMDAHVYLHHRIRGQPRQEPPQDKHASSGTNQFYYKAVAFY